jgi:hypothetical protein
VKRLQEATPSGGKTKGKAGPVPQIADEKRRVEQLEHSRELRKALEEVRLAREAAARAEKERLTALKAAQDATKAAEKAIDAKRELDKRKNPDKLAAIPKLNQAPGVLNRFDGQWRFQFTWNEFCPRNKGPVPVWTIQDGLLHGKAPRGAASGSVSPDGDLRVQWFTPFGPAKTINKLIAKLRGSEGEGTWQIAGRQCGGTVKLTRVD